MNKTLEKKMDRMRGLTLGRRSQSVAGPLSGAASWLIAALMLFSANLFAGNEQTFDALQIGAQTYQNVRVTTKAKSYIFISHSAGLASIKVSELPNDVLQKLGYIAAAKPQTNSATLWAKQTLGKMDGPQVKRIEAQLLQKWSGIRFLPKMQLPKISTGLIFAASLTMLLAYAFLSYCCCLICQKTGNEPGALVWLPLLQALPLLRAASMPAWWFVALFIPGVNLLGYVMWCAKIVEARRKTTLLLVLMLLPITNLFAFLYLAFSESTPGKTEPAEPKLEIMTLEIA